MAYFLFGKMLKYRTKYKKCLEKINVPRIASNISGVTSAQCVKERPRKEWSPKINEAGTWPLSKPRRAEEKEYDMKMAATNTKDLCLPSVFFSFCSHPSISLQPGTQLTFPVHPMEYNNSPYHKELMELSLIAYA